MGMCLEKRKEIDQDDLIICDTPYKSSYDKYFYKVEFEYNIINYIQSSELLYLFSYEVTHEHNIPDHEEGSLEDQLTELKFSRFINEKILGHFFLSHIDNESLNVMVFMDFIRRIYLNIQQTLITFRKSEEPVEINKLHLVPFLILYSKSSKNAKKDILYKILMNSDGYIERNNSTQEFIFILFAVPSIISILSLIDLQNLYEFLKVEKEDLRKILDTTEIKDIKRAARNFLDNFFLGKKSIDLIEYNEKFKNENYMWIFDCKGIRMELERLNDVKPTNK